MPQAVKTYLKTNNLTDVDNTKHEILELYNDDFMKIDPSGRVSKLFSAIPAQLSENASRYQINSVLDKRGNKDAISELLRDLEASLTVIFAHHSNAPNIGMPMHTDYGQYKLYVGDTGLFVTLAFWINHPQRISYIKKHCQTNSLQILDMSIKILWHRCLSPLATGSFTIHGQLRAESIIMK